MRWIILGFALCTAVAGFTSAKLHTRWKLAQTMSKHEHCADVPCAHHTVRMQAIKSVVDQLKGQPVYLVIGDSITEFADLEPICGRKPINAGIAWATVETWRKDASLVASTAQPDFIVIALGSNNARLGRADFAERMAELVASLRPYHLVLMRITDRSDTEVEPYNAALPALGLTARKVLPVQTTDGVHLSPSSYGEWKRTMREALTDVCQPPAELRESSTELLPRPTK